MDIAALLENRKKEKGFTPESFCESVLNEYGYRAHVLASLMAFDQIECTGAAKKRIIKNCKNKDKFLSFFYFI